MRLPKRLAIIIMTVIIVLTSVAIVPAKSESLPNATWYQSLGTFTTGEVQLDGKGSITCEAVLTAPKSGTCTAILYKNGKSTGPTYKVAYNSNRTYNVTKSTYVNGQWVKLYWPPGQGKGKYKVVFSNATCPQTIAFTQIIIKDN